MAEPSSPIGGFTVNRRIAEDLVRKTQAARNISAKLNKAFELYRRWRRSAEDLSSFSPDYQNFIQNFHQLTYRVEEVKIALCRSIREWKLDANLNLSVPIALPSDPFSRTSNVINA